jgi:Uma2 family endonuclease
MLPGTYMWYTGGMKLADLAIDPKGRYTYKDYLSWPDEFRCELINGVIYDMCAAPRRVHQDVSRELVEVFLAFFKGKQCTVYFAPFDVILTAFGDRESDSDTVVQPDLSVFCDRSKLTDAGATGAPELAVEILSPSTAFKDQEEKRHLYERHRVREYWVVNPANETIMIYMLGDDGKFLRPELVCRGEVVRSSIFPGLEVAIDTILPAREDRAAQ